MSIRTLLAAIAISAGLSSAASAAHINLNVSKGWTTGSHTYTNGSESVTAEAFIYSSAIPPVLSGDPSIASWSGSNGGIGVCSGTTGSGYAGCSGDQHKVDGATVNEMVVFDFGPLVVNLTGIVFSHVDRNDQFEVFTFANGVNAPATFSDIYQNLPNNCSVCYTNNFTSGPASVFGIGAYNHNAQWKIKKIKFDVISTIPLPAGLPLMLGGIALLGGLGAARGRRDMAA